VLRREEIEEGRAHIVAPIASEDAGNTLNGNRVVHCQITTAAPPQLDRGKRGEIAPLTATPVASFSR
jgi:hypothetical protein